MSQRNRRSFMPIHAYIARFVCESLENRLLLSVSDQEIIAPGGGRSPADGETAGNPEIRAPKNLHITGLTLVDGGDNILPASTIGEMVFVQATWTTSNLDGSEQYVVRFSMDGVPLDSGTVTGAVGQNLGYYWWLGGWYASPGAHTISATVDGAFSEN